MEVQKIGPRVTTFSFDFEFNQEPISVLVIVVRQEKPGCSNELKGVHHVNFSSHM